MLHQIIFASVMLISLISMAGAAFSRTTGSRKWAVAACTGALVYGTASYINLFSSADTFLMTRAVSLSALALMSFSYVFAIAEAANVVLVKPIRLGVSAVGFMLMLVMATMRIHGMCLFAITVGEPDSIGMRTATYSCRPLYFISIGLMAIITLIGMICLIAGMSKKTMKTPSSLKFLSVLSLFVLVGITAGDLIGEFTGITMVTPVCVAIGDLLLLLIVRKIDRSDILDFGKNCAIDSTNDGVIILDKNNNFMFANKTAKSLFFELSESDNQKVKDFIASISENNTVKRGERTFAFKKSNFTDYNGNCDCNVIMIHDKTEQKLRDDRLNEEAAIDSITGLNSRSSVVDILTDVCSNTTGILLNISFDGFKALNNLYGHEEANKLLATFGAILRNNTNTDDVRGRLGGEQFVIFLKNCSNESVVAHLTMRIEEQIVEATRKQFGKTDISVGVSVGGVHVPNYGRDYELLSEHADAELRKIKNSGGHGFSICGGIDKPKDTGSEKLELTDSES